MTEEEKKAIENIKWHNEHLYCDKKDVDYLLNLIQKKDTEINKLNKEIDRMAKYIYSKTDFTTCGNIKFIKEYFMKEDSIGK